MSSCAAAKDRDKDKERQRTTPSTMVNLPILSFNHLYQDIVLIKGINYLTEYFIYSFIHRSPVEVYPEPTPGFSMRQEYIIRVAF